MQGQANDAAQAPLRVAPPPSSLGRVLDFMRLLWAVEHGLTRISRRMERTLGVTDPQRLVVRVVGRQPGISAGELAETLVLHPSTLTEILRRLTQRDVLERIADPADARRALFRLTSKGLELDAMRRGTGEARVRTALGAVSSEDLGAAARVLAQIARSLADDA